MADFVKISKSEMFTYLESIGFQLIDPGKLNPGNPAKCQEYVFGRIVYVRSGNESVAMSLRIYTSIDRRTNEMRDNGKDAIRCRIFRKHPTTGNVVPIMGSKRIHRVANWKSNLIKRLESMRNSITVCNHCGDVMIQRKAKKTGSAFLGCFRYPDCRNTINIDS